MNFIGWIFQNLVYRPQLNLLQFFYDFTGDIGISIVLLAAIVNLILWPLFIGTYLNSQKIKVLQPKLKEIQDKHKDNQQELLKATVEFNRKHGINNTSFLVVLIAQIFFASGLLYLTRDLSQDNITVQLYENLFGRSDASFSNTAFGFLDIGLQARNFIWLPLANLVFSYLYGLYTFKLAPNNQLPTLPSSGKGKKGGIDPKTLQKSLEFQTLYVMPVFIFLINFTFSVGVNLYFVTVSFLALVRQIFVSQYYKNHTTELIEKISQTDPEFTEDTSVQAPQLAEEATTVKVIKKKSVKAKKTAKKKTAKAKKKSTKKTS